MNIEKLAIEHGSTCYTGQQYHFERWQLEAFAKALQSSEPVAKPDAWLVPMILDFTNAKKVHFTRSEKGKNLTDDELKAEWQGTVSWKAETVYINDSNEPVTDKYGVRHYAKPLFTHPPAPVQSSEPVAWQPMSSAAKDGRLLRLLVNFSDNSLEDDDKPVETIGHNSFSDTGIDQWQFAGWNWQQDCYTEGVGTPVGWLPFTHPPATVPEGYALVPIEPTVDMIRALMNGWETDGSKPMSDNYETMLSASPTPPNAVPLEKYNKVVEIAKKALTTISDTSDEGYTDISQDLMYISKTYFKTRTAQVALQAIAEAEGKEG